MRAPMARAVVGGLVTSTILTLVVVPVVYTILDDLAAWLHRKWRAGRPGWRCRHEAAHAGHDSRSGRGGRRRRSARAAETPSAS